jgi:hypothetical protein
MEQGRPIDVHDRCPEPSETPLPGDTIPALQSQKFRRCHHEELRQMSGRAMTLQGMSWTTSMTCLATAYSGLIDGADASI